MSNNLSAAAAKTLRTFAAAGRAAVTPVQAPAARPAREVNAAGVIILTAKATVIDDEGYAIDLDNKGLRTGGRSLWTR